MDAGKLKQKVFALLQTEHDWPAYLNEGESDNVVIPTKEKLKDILGWKADSADALTETQISQRDSKLLDLMEQVQSLNDQRRDMLVRQYEQENPHAPIEELKTLFGGNYPASTKLHKLFLSISDQLGSHLETTGDYSYKRDNTKQLIEKIDKIQLQMGALPTHAEALLNTMEQYSDHPDLQKIIHIIAYEMLSDTLQSEAYMPFLKVAHSLQKLIKDVVGNSPPVITQNSLEILDKNLKKADEALESLNNYAFPLEDRIQEASHKHALTVQRAQLIEPTLGILSGFLANVHRLHTDIARDMGTSPGDTSPPRS